MPPRTRSPEPVACDCKYRHRHGTRRMYVVHRCGCFPCRVAHSRTTAEWRHGGTTAEDRYVDSAGTRRRIEGLAALGWTLRQIGAELGCSDMNVTYLRRCPRVHVATAARVKAAAGRLAGRLPPTGWLADRLRREAAAKGWVSLFAWDEDDGHIDDPAALPHTPGSGPWDLKPCGTLAAVRRHYRRGEPLCGPCRAAGQRREDVA